MIEENKPLEEEKNERLMLSIDQTAEILGISISLMYQLSRTDGFPVTKIGRRSLISKKALEEWIDKKSGTVVL
ncbi:helix-turn-helix domain-containing protein [Eubacterium callanderi]|jgi:excisionase family DNA binding protein|uniref:helix-turn-helix domain-containing protein n=1 Tax=Eubacterium callanderi TaxID=53442 RepID=UPI001C127045|nr:helix-turn-helix domain-containing protein [Eubacterium callanderi]MBU5305484.1 helix-turn-helix domain-containing protein [Eubacterium callanderi]